MSTVTEDLPQGRDRAAEILRGVSRFLAERGECSLAEFTLKSGRRVDLIALDRKGIVTVVEIKSSVADYRSDKSGMNTSSIATVFFSRLPPIFLLRCCQNRVASFSPTVLALCPSRAARGHVQCARRKALMLRFARTSAARLHIHRS